MENQALEWTANEYHHPERSSDWYWAVSIIIITGTVLAVIFGNLLFAIVVAVGGFSILLYAKRRPESIKLRIDREGARIANTFYPYSSLASFYVEKEDLFPKILFKSSKTLMPLIVFPIGENDPALIRSFLANYLTEEKLEEPLSLKIVEYLGF